MALEKFKNSLASIKDEKDKQVFDPNVIINNDFLLNFLRVRYLNITKATSLLLEYFHWRAKNNVDDIYTNFIFKELPKVNLIMPHGLHKVSKGGYPVYFQIMNQFNANEILKLTTVDQMIKHYILFCETLERDVFKVCSHVKG